MQVLPLVYPHPADERPGLVVLTIGLEEALHKLTCWGPPSQNNNKIQ